MLSELCEIGRMQEQCVVYVRYVAGCRNSVNGIVLPRTELARSEAQLLDSAVPCVNTVGALKGVRCGGACLQPLGGQCRLQGTCDCGRVIT